MLAPKDYVQIHQALHFTLGFAQRRMGQQIDGSEITQEDCDKLGGTIVKVERVLETALRMHKAAQETLLAKPPQEKLIYAGREKKLVVPGQEREDEILKFRSTEQNQGEIK